MYCKNDNVIWLYNTLGINNTYVYSAPQNDLDKHKMTCVDNFMDGITNIHRASKISP